MASSLLHCVLIQQGAVQEAVLLFLVGTLCCIFNLALVETQTGSKFQVWVDAALYYHSLEKVKVLLNHDRFTNMEKLLFTKKSQVKSCFCLLCLVLLFTMI